MASEPERTQLDGVEPPVRRSAARHAAPRITVRGRMQLPVGRALALTAVPTALLMGSLAPKFAFAADTKAAPISAPTTSGHSAAGNGVDCSKGATAPASAPTGTAGGSTGKHTGRTGTAAKHAGTSAPAPHSTAKTTPTAPGTAPSPTPTHARNAPGDPQGPVAGLLNGLTGLLGLTAAAPAPTTAAPAPTTAAPRTAAVPAAAATSAPTATATGAPSTPASTAPTTAPTGAAPTKSTPPAAAVPSAPAATTGTHRMCDASKLAAPLVSTGYAAGQMPMDAWTLKSSDLKLTHTEFHGVRKIQLPDGTTVRVLMFTADTVGDTAGVDIGDLDMSVKQDGRLLHVQGGPGTTSTMTGGQVTMYVTSLSGTLKAAEGIPLGWLNVNLTLTPDSLPDWLFNLVGDLPIPLSLEFSNATVIQQGQFGGNLTIPGMHLYYTPLN